MNLAVPLYFSRSGIGSDSTGQHIAEFSRLEIDSAHYDGVADVRFYVVAKNDDTVDLDIAVVDDSGTVYASRTVPANTSTFTLMPPAIVPGGLLSGLQGYRLRFDQNATGSLQLVASESLLLVRQVDATKTRIQHPVIVSDHSSESRADLALPGYNSTSSATFVLPGASDGTNTPTFHRLDSRYADIVDWTFEAMLRVNFADDATVFASLFRLSDDAQVSASEVTVTGDTAPGKLYRASWSSDANWSDNEQYYVMFRRTASVGSRTGWIRQANVYIRLENLSKADVPFRVSRRRAEGLSAVTERQRTFIDRSWFQVAGFAYEHCGVGTDDSGHVTRLFDAGSSDSGTSGSQIAASELLYSATRQTRRSAALTLSDADRRFLHWRNASSSNIDAQAFVIVGGEGVPVDAVTESVGVYDRITADVLAYQAGDASEAVGVYDRISAQLFSQESGDVAETVGLYDRITANLFDFEGGVVTETVGLYDRISAILGDGVFKSGDRVLATAEFTTAAGILRAAVLTVRHPLCTFDGKVIDWGVIDRSIPAPGGLVRVGDARIRLADADGKVRRLLSQKTFVNQPVFLKLGKEGGSFAAFIPLYRGRAVMSAMGQSWTEIAVKDSVWEFYETKIEGLITVDNFPALEEGTVAPRTRWEG